MRCIGLGEFIDTVVVWAQFVVSTRGYPGLVMVMFLKKHLSAHSVRGHPSQFLPHPWSARMAERLLLHQPMV